MAGGKEANEGLLRELAEARGRAQQLEAELAQKVLQAQQLEARAAAVEARAGGGGGAMVAAGAGGAADQDLKGAVQQGLARPHGHPSPQEALALSPLSAEQLPTRPRAALTFGCDLMLPRPPLPPPGRAPAEHRGQPVARRHPPRHEQRGALARHVPVVPPRPREHRGGGAHRRRHAAPGAPAALCCCPRGKRPRGPPLFHTLLRPPHPPRG